METAAKSAASPRRSPPFPPPAITALFTAHSSFQIHPCSESPAGRTADPITDPLSCQYSCSGDDPLSSLEDLLRGQAQLLTGFGILLDKTNRTTNESIVFLESFEDLCGGRPAFIAALRACSRAIGTSLTASSRGYFWTALRICCTARSSCMPPLQQLYRAGLGVTPSRREGQAAG